MLPSDSRAESQAGLNGPSGSPTSLPRRDWESLLILAFIVISILAVGSMLVFPGLWYPG